MKPTDLRGILHYVPQFRDKVFVIAIDGAVVADDNFGNILLDIAVLRSLNIRVVLVHGAGYQIKTLAETLQKKISNWEGTGVTDAELLRISTMGANQVTHEILEGLSLNDLRAAHTNCIEAVPVGILKGVDHQYTGKIHQVDSTLLRMLLEKSVVPVLPPLGFDRNGQTYRLNSDAVAVDVARSLGAVKLMYITTHKGLEVNGQMVSQMYMQELDATLKSSSKKIQPDMISKAQHALWACQVGIPRVHIINGQENEGLLTEIFSNEGVGTLIYANEYQAIRPARRKDIRRIMSLIKSAINSEQLIKRTRSSVEKRINDYYVFEIDDNIIGTVSLHIYPEQKKAELASLLVNPAHEHQGIGTKLSAFAENLASQQGIEKIYCLSTQTFTFFQHKLGYTEGTIDDLPAPRREKYEQSKRNSKVLIKNLVPQPPKLLSSATREHPLTPSAG